MSNAEKTDAELVREALASPDAFAGLVAKYEKRLRAYVSRLGSFDPEAANDILQETFIKAYINLNDFNPAFALNAWLYRIARNETVNYFRKQKNQPRVFTSEEDTGVFEKLADTLDLEYEAHSASERSAVRAALEELDFKYRDALFLRYFEEKTYSEISDIMEVPEGTVAAYINRAKAKLKEKLARYDTKS